MRRELQRHRPRPPDLAVHLVDVDVGLMEEEGKDAGVEPVCDEDLPASEHCDGAPEHRVVVKLAFVLNLVSLLIVSSLLQ